MISNVDRSKAYHVVSLALEHVQKASTGTAITSADLAGGFALKKNSKENPMREVELMTHIALTIPEHKHFFSTLVGFGVSANDLYVLTKELDSSNLLKVVFYHHLRFTEGEVRVIVRRLLQGLELLHAHDIAHCDIKAENTVFRIKREVTCTATRTTLLTKLRASSVVDVDKRLTPTDLSMLDAMLIDFGQAVWAKPPPQGSHLVVPMQVDKDGPPTSVPIAPPSMQVSQPSPNSVQTVENVSPVPSFALLPAPVASLLDRSPVPQATPWLQPLAGDRDPPGIAHSMTPEHSNFKREERLAKLRRGSNHKGPALPPRDFQPTKIDMWQIGLLMYLLLTGKHLLPQKVSTEDREIFFQNPHYVENALAETGVRVSPQCSALLLKLLKLDPSVRIDASAAVGHAWFTTNT